MLVKYGNVKTNKIYATNLIAESYLAPKVSQALDTHSADNFKVVIYISVTRDDSVTTEDSELD